VWLIGLIALRALGPAAGVAAAALAAIYPPLVWICAYVLSEALYGTLVLAAVLLLDCAMDRADEARATRAGGALALAAGLVIGAGILTRPGLLIYLPLAALWCVMRRRTILAVAVVVAA